MADLVLDMDYNITKAEAKQRKLDRELQLSQQKAQNIKKQMEKTADNIELSKRRQSEYNAELEATANKLDAADKKQIWLSQRQIESLEKQNAASLSKLEKEESYQNKQEQLLAKQNLQLDSQNAKTAEISEKIVSNTKKQSNFGKAIKNSTKPLNTFSKRVAGLVKRVFVFTMITKALRAMREALGNYLKQDSKLSSSIAKLKGNLATIGATIVSALSPYIQWIVDKLVYVTSLLGKVLARILGKNISQMAELAEKASDTAKSGEKAKASFDTLQVASGTSDNTENSTGTDTSGINEVSDSQVDAFIKKLKEALPLVTAIGAALLAWNIIKFLKQFETISKWLTGGKIVGILMIIVGLVLLISNYCDAWVNGLDWGNFLGILTGVALVVGGLALVFGKIGAAIGLIVGGIAMVVIGIKDWIENGKSLKSVLMVVVGILAVGLGLMLAGVGWPALLVAAIVAAIVVIAAYWNEIKTAVSSFIEWFSVNVLDKLFGKGVGDALQGMWDAFTRTFEDIIDFFKHIFAGEWKEAGKALVNIIVDLLNFGINKLNFFIQGLLGGGAKLINAFGKLFGQEWNLDASHIKIPNIPRLATGAVIPGGSPFLSILGDQPKGKRNLEAPEDLIRQIVREETGGKNFTITANGSLAPLIRLLNLEIKQENERSTVF